MSSRIYERSAVLATIDPASVAVGTAAPDEVDMSNFRRALFVVMTGAMGAGGSVNFKLQAATAAGGAFADVPGKAIAALLQTAGKSNTQSLVEIRADELAEGQRFVRGLTTVAGAACQLAVLALGGDPRSAPADHLDLASVNEVVK
jgi:hypothetical protein